MIRTIGLIPSVIERRNSNNLIIDNNLIKFLRKCFPKYKLQILIGDKKTNNLDLVISPGGNSIVSINSSKVNKYRKILDEYYFKYSLKKDIPYLGICHGAQYIAKFYKSKIIKKNKHTKNNHLIYFNSIKKSQVVNSYHDYSITKLGKNLDVIAYTKDGSIEAFQHKEKKILGIMWHPERYKKIKKFDLQFLNKYL